MMRIILIISFLFLVGCSAKFDSYDPTTAMFRCGNDADYSGAKVVLNMSNDRGMALIGGRGNNNRSYGGILSLDNIGRESNVMTYHGGNGAGIGSITFYSGETATTTRATIITNNNFFTVLYKRIKLIKINNS